MRKPTPFLFLSSLLLIVTSISGCWSFYDEPRNGNFVAKEAYVPIYGIDTSYKIISTLAPQPTVSSGKIFVLGSTLYQVENYKGVHVINFSDRTKPVKIGFIKCTGATEVAVKNGYLVVNNAADLVTIDINDPAQVREVGRVKDAFPTYYTDIVNTQRPPGRGYYVCPSLPAANYEVIEWKLEKNVPSPNCYN